jgi:Flp pilus assembly pilin Flp
VCWLIVSIATRFANLTSSRQREEGQTMAEYAILLGVIALVVVAVAVLFGKSISSIFNSTSGKI